MPAPTSFGSAVGEPIVYTKPNLGNSGSYAPDPRFRADSVTIGSRDDYSRGHISSNRDVILRLLASTSALYQDSFFLVAYRYATGSPPGAVLFEGVGQVLNKLMSGSGGGAESSGLDLRDATILFADASSSQIAGRFMPRVPSGVSNGELVVEPAIPAVFNSYGAPNRSVKTAKGTVLGSTSIFSATNQHDVHYFTDDGGSDFADNSGVPARLKARYWTYAQAIAYVLNFYTGARPGVGTAVTRNNVKLWFGAPPEVTPPTSGDPRYPDDTTVWSAVIGPNRSDPYYKQEPPGEPYEAGGQTPPTVPANFSPDARRLLTAKVNNVSIEGMNCLEALAALLQAAGLGWWIDPFQAGSNLDTMVGTGPTHVFRIWTPGGTLVTGGLGVPFVPKLQPYYTDLSGATTASAILTKNNIELLNANWDYAQIVNQPLVVMAPTLYEVTVYLRPGWEPVHSINTAFIDNVDPQAIVNDPENPSATPTELQDADAAGNALRSWVNNPGQILLGHYPAGPLGRMQFLCQALHARGSMADRFYDVLRKWVVPCDLSYPTSVFGRTKPNGLPYYFGHYEPTDFSIGQLDQPPPNQTTQSVVLMYGIKDQLDILTGGTFTGAQGWAHRRRRFLPCLVSDANGESIGFRVEINLQGSDDTRWFEYTGYQVLDDDLGVMLNFENPCNVIEGTKNQPGTLNPSNNLYNAYIRGLLRVRITATIEGSDPTFIRASDWSAQEFGRYRNFIRRDKYVRKVVLSKHRDQWVNDPKLITQFNQSGNNPAPVLPQNPAAKFYLFRPADDSRSARDEANRIQAVRGDPKISSSFVIPWVELDARPGSPVEKIEESGTATPPEVPRSVSFRTLAGGGIFLAPHIASTSFSFAAGGFRTSCTLEDWRALGVRHTG